MPTDVSPIHDKRIPKGYRVTYHEERGCEAPDRWYEASRGHQVLSACPTGEEAIRLCIARAKRRPKSLGSIKTLFKKKLRVWRTNERVMIYFGNVMIPLTYDNAEALKNLLEKADSLT